MYINEEMIPGVRGYMKNTAWSGFVYGIATVIYGVFTIIAPIATLSAFVIAIGFLVLLHGVMLIITSLIGIKRDPLWLAGFAAGMLQLLLGGFIASRAGNISSMALMVSTVGIGLIGIFSGAFSFISAVRYHDAVKNVGQHVLRGVLLFIIGISMLLAPFGFGTAMVRTVGIIALVFGLLQLWSSVKLIKELKA